MKQHGTDSRRRQSKGSAWYWKQTDSWYFTPPGTQKRVPLFDEQGQRIRGKDRKPAAQLALGRLKVAGKWRPPAAPTGNGAWLVARVCSEYLQYCERRVVGGTMSADHRAHSIHYLNDLCGYCGALPVSELNKGHVRYWLESHPSWRSPATIRNAVAIVLAAFNQAEELHGVGNPLRGLKKPTARPRLHSFSKEDEAAIYAATDKPFRDFLFTVLHTGVRPFCELAKLTADEVIESERGMMWRVYSSKTGKSRKIPVRNEVAQLTRDLMRTAPRGSGLPLFQNSRGSRWLKVTGVGRFLKIKKELGWDKDSVRRHYSTYSCRHTFAHRMLSGYWNGGAGCSIEVLAELMGDTPKVAFDHYGREWGQHYQEPLWTAIGVGPEPARLPDETKRKNQRRPRNTA